MLFERRRWLSLPLIPTLFFLAGSAEGQEAGQVPERNDVPDKYKWDLTRLYADRDAWEAEFRACETAIDRLAAYQGKVSESPEQLVAFLKLRDDVLPRFEKMFVYTMLSKDQDTRQPEPQAMYDRARGAYVKLSETLSWFEPEILTLPEGRLLEWCRTQPDLKIYEHAFENLLRQQQHVLSAREEELLAMSGKVMDAPQQVYTLLTNADLEFPTIQDAEGNDVQVSEGRYSLFMESPDRALRERAFKALVGTYIRYKNGISALLAGSIHGDVFRARARKYDSALHAALDPDKVPVEVYHNLVATVHEHLPKLHRYMEIRRRQLGVDQVHLYDTFIPLIEGEAPKIKYDDAVATIVTGLEPLGSDYLTPMESGFQSRWIDVFETKGKRSGAYSAGTYLAPPYILLNYNDTYNDMFTVAHEMGHSMHSYLTARHQPPVYGDYPIFLAEVASTCNEIILGEHLRDQARAAGDVDTQLFLVNLALENIRGTVINQTMWAEYELLLHEMAEKNEPLTYETMATPYGELVRTYFGPAYGHDEEVDGYWLRIPHFYRGFYVYKYATSYCASVALGQRVMTGDPDKLDAYLGFLKSGSSDYPIDILKAAGVDMSTPAPIHATMELFGRLLDDLERLLEEEGQVSRD